VLLLCEHGRRRREVELTHHHTSHLSLPSSFSSHHRREELKEGPRKPLIKQYSITNTYNTANMVKAGMYDAFPTYHLITGSIGLGR